MCQLLKKSKFTFDVHCNKNGVVTKIHAEKVGLIAMKLGAGRESKNDIIDLSVGIVFNKKCGDKVKEGEVLATVYANDEIKGKIAVEELLKEIEISQDKFEKSLIYEIVR